MRKIFIIAAFISLFVPAFAQDNTTPDVTIEEAQEKSRGFFKELFEFRIFMDALKVRQFYDIHRTNTHNLLLQERVIDFRDKTKINFSVKGEVEYDHFWVWISNNPSARTPDGYTNEMLSANYLVKFSPKWDITQAPPKDSRLYTANATTTLPDQIISNLSLEMTEFNELINKEYKNNEDSKTIKLRNDDIPIFVNAGLFNGFNYLEGRISGDEVDLTKFPLILWGEDAIDNNTTFNFWEKVPKEIQLLAYNNDELYKVDWVYGESTLNNTKYINLTINNDYFGENNSIDIALSRSNTTRNYKLKKIDINEEQIIEEALNSLTSLREEFEKLKNEIESYLTDNMESIIFNKNSKYLSEGMSKLFVEPTLEFEDDFNKTLLKMYGIDVLMQVEDDYSGLHAEIENIFKDENKSEFISEVMADVVFVEPTNTEEDLIKNYKTQLENITIKKLKERIKKEE
ncbi:MAG: hypothetical protein PF485_14940 [Bacteroidales bacterium]|jgi:hypothetical protein|nr:hypothetical protein [Bacteroidales bacterium]